MVCAGQLQYRSNNMQNDSGLPSQIKRQVPKVTRVTEISELVPGVEVLFSTKPFTEGAPKTDAVECGVVLRTTMNMKSAEN